MYSPYCFISSYLRQVRLSSLLSSLMFSLLLCAFFCSSLSIFSSSFASQEEQAEKKRIRIGYEGNFGIFQANPIPDSEGYGYELFQELMKYTKNRYEIEFVEVAWTEGLRMLLEGELDLLPLANYTEERAQIYGYTKNPLIYEAPVLLALKDNAAIGGDYKGLKGAKIAIHLDNANYDELSHFLKARNIDATITEIPYTPITQIREEGYFDYMVSSSLQLEEKLNYAFSLKSHPLYILGNKNNQALLDEIDYALEQLNIHDFLFEKKLFVKYFYHDIVHRAFISEEEFTLLKAREYNVGVMNLNAPVSFYNEKTNALDGLFLEIIHKFNQLSDIQLHVHELPQNATQSEIEAMDFSLIPNGVGKEWGLPLSIPFTQMPYILVEKRVPSNQIKKSGAKTVATSTFLNLNEAFIANVFHKNDIKVLSYESPQDVVKAFNQGTVDAILCTRALYNALYDYFDHDILYQVSEIDSYYTPVITFSSDFPQENIDVFNKLITHLDNKEVEDALIRTSIRFFIVSSIPRLKL